MNLPELQTDIRHYGDDELILQVMNDEALYDIRHEQFLNEIIDEQFIYNSNQLDNLKIYLKDN